MSSVYGSPLFIGGSQQISDLPPLLSNFRASIDESQTGQVILSADKMEKGRAKDLAGAVWVYGDHAPKNANDGTRIELTRDEAIKPDAAPFITLEDIPVSDADTETIVNVKESDGQLHPYLYLHNNYEGGGAGLLLRKDIYQVTKYNDSGTNIYENTTLDLWCENTFVAMLDSSVKSKLNSVSIPVRNGLDSTESTLDRQCFVLSSDELGVQTSAVIGSKLPYFSNDTRRIATYNTSNQGYFTRTMYSLGDIIVINGSGTSGLVTNNATTFGYRPAFCLPLTFQLNPTPNPDGSYDMYEESSVQTLATGKTIADLPSKSKVKLGRYAGQESPPLERTVAWDKKKEFHARQFTYNSKKQYQTMLEGAIAYLPVMPDGQELSQLPSKSKIKLGKWNNTVLKWIVCKDTSDNQVRLILDGSSYNVLGEKQFDAPEPSNSNSDRRSSGNNRYIQSNLHQWLNSNKPANQWYTSQHGADAPPNYANQNGFLNQWTEKEIKSLELANWTVTKSSVDGSGSETFRSRVTLASTTELGLESGTGGGRLDIMNSNGDRGLGNFYWCRTPHLSFADSVRGVNGVGSLYFERASYAFGVRPLCKPIQTTLVSAQPDSDGCYTLV